MMGGPRVEVDKPLNNQHWVRLARPFLLSAHPITRGQFRRFVQDSGYKTEAEAQGFAFEWSQGRPNKKPHRTWLNPGDQQTNAHPVVVVSSRASHNRADARRLWAISVALTGARYAQLEAPGARG